jgi:hypothetical protein
MHKRPTSTLVILVQVDMTKLVGVNLASSHVYQDSSGQSYSMGTSLMSGPKYHIIRTPAVPTRKAQDGETTMYLFLLIHSFSICLPVFSNHFSDSDCVELNGRLTGRNFIGSSQGLIWRIIQEVFWRDWGKARKTSVGVVVCRYRYDPGTSQLQWMTASYLIVNLSNFML